MRYFVILFLFISSPSWSQVKQRFYDVQKIIKLTETVGTVYYLPVGTKIFIQAKIGQTFPAGTIFKTKDKANGIFKFLLNGSLSLAPSSILRVEVSKENRLMLWQLEGSSKISIPDRPHWVLTKSGIGLTKNSDLHLVAHKENQKSGILVYKGYVNLYKVDPSIFNVESLFKIKEVAFLDGLKRVRISEGEYSYFSDEEEATLPVKISPIQYEILKDIKLSSWIHNERRLKLIRSFDRLPEGVFSKQFNIEPPDLQNQVKKAARGKSIKSLRNEGLYAAEGQFLIKTNDYRPPAGGYIDFKTANYIAPKDGSDYDPNMNVYIPSSFLGTVDIKTGEYISPLGLSLIHI